MEKTQSTRKRMIELGGGGVGGRIGQKEEDLTTFLSLLLSLSAGELHSSDS